jgi:hypothetical protein
MRPLPLWERAVPIVPHSRLGEGLSPHAPVQQGAPSMSNLTERDGPITWPTEMLRSEGHNTEMRSVASAGAASGFSTAMFNRDRHGGICWPETIRPVHWRRAMHADELRGGIVTLAQLDPDQWDVARPSPTMAHGKTGYGQQGSQELPLRLQHCPAGLDRVLRVVTSKPLATLSPCLLALPGHRCALRVLHLEPRLQRPRCDTARPPALRRRPPAPSGRRARTRSGRLRSDA